METSTADGRTTERSSPRNLNRLLYLFLNRFRIMYTIMLCQVKTQPVWHTFYIYSLNCFVLYIILIVCVTNIVSTGVYQTFFVLLLFCSLIYQKLMADKIHVFPFPNDLYLMCDLLLLLLLLLARCKTLWHHLFEVIIYRLNGLQLGYNCLYALCVVTGVIAPRLLYLFLFLFRIMYIIMLYQVKPQPVCYIFLYLFP